MMERIDESALRIPRFHARARLYIYTDVVYTLILISFYLPIIF